MFKPFSDEQLQEMDERFGAIHLHTPAAKARPAWAKKSDTPPEPPYSLVFRACVPGEWDNVMSQANDAKQKARSPKNLAMATIVAVSVDGDHVVHTGAMGQPANERAASKPARDALEKLMQRPGCAGIGEAVADALGELNGVVGDAAEKG